MQQWNSATVQREKHYTVLIVIISGLASSKNYVDDYLCSLKKNRGNEVSRPKIKGNKFCELYKPTRCTGTNKHKIWIPSEPVFEWFETNGF